MVAVIDHLFQERATVYAVALFFIREREMETMRSIELYGTPAFSRETMRKTIGWGQPFYTPDGKTLIGFSLLTNPGHLSFAPWLDMMPYVYEATAIKVIRELEPRWAGMLIQEDTIEKIIDDFLLVWEALFTRLENGGIEDAHASRKTDEEGTPA